MHTKYGRGVGCMMKVMRNCYVVFKEVDIFGTFMSTLIL